MAEPFGSTGEVPKPRCIDPFKCYQSRPNLPYDYTVEIIDNGINANENEVNTTFVYKCATESKYKVLQKRFIISTCFPKLIS